MNFITKKKKLKKLIFTRIYIYKLFFHLNPFLILSLNILTILSILGEITTLQ